MEIRIWGRYERGVKIVEALRRPRREIGRGRRGRRSARKKPTKKHMRDREKSKNSLELVIACSREKERLALSLIV